MELLDTSRVGHAARVRGRRVRRGAGSVTVHDLWSRDRRITRTTQIVGVQRETALAVDGLIRSRAEGLLELKTVPEETRRGSTRWRMLMCSSPRSGNRRHSAWSSGGWRWSTSTAKRVDRCWPALPERCVRGWGRRGGAVEHRRRVQRLEVRVCRDTWTARGRSAHQADPAQERGSTRAVTKAKGHRETAKAPMTGSPGRHGRADAVDVPEAKP